MVDPHAHWLLAQLTIEVEVRVNVEVIQYGVEIVLKIGRLGVVECVVVEALDHLQQLTHIELGLEEVFAVPFGDVKVEQHDEADGDEQPADQQIEQYMF